MNGPDPLMVGKCGIVSWLIDVSGISLIDKKGYVGGISLLVVRTFFFLVLCSIFNFSNEVLGVLSIMFSLDPLS